MTQLTGLAFTVALLAVVVSMISSMALKDPQPRQRFTTTAAVMRAVAAASVTLGALLAPYLVVGDVVFVAIMTAATAARRFGQRATILGMVAFMTYFVALFLGATLSMVPWLIIGLTIGTAVSLAMSSALQVGPDRAVRRGLRSLEARLGQLLDFVRAGLATPRRAGLQPRPRLTGCPSLCR